jgi:hypothetical protein
MAEKDEETYVSLVICSEKADDEEDGEGGSQGTPLATILAAIATAPAVSAVVNAESLPVETGEKKGAPVAAQKVGVASPAAVVLGCPL